MYINFCSQGIIMKSNRILAIAALSLLATVGAQAETYDGVHPLTHSASRAQVKAEAVIAAHSPNPYADGFDAGPPAPITSEVARADVKEEAVVAAHSPDPYADGYDAGVPAPIVSEVARSTVHAEAVEEARAPRLNVYGMAY